jgi:hypothetical protein
MQLLITNSSIYHTKRLIKYVFNCRTCHFLKIIFPLLFPSQLFRQLPSVRYEQPFLDLPIEI